MFIQLLIRFSVVTGFALASVCGTAGTEFGCTAPELIQGVPALNHYNELICSGISYVESGKYAAAVKSFEEALAIKIHESPNFELLPRLAWARFKQGDISAARDDLMRAELSLSVFAGLIHCQETDVGFHLKKNSSGERLTGKISTDVEHMMCGAAYDYIYRRETLDHVLQEAELVKRYLDVKKRIHGVKR